MLALCHNHMWPDKRKELQDNICVRFASMPWIYFSGDIHFCIISLSVSYSDCYFPLPASPLTQLTVFFLNLLSAKDKLTSNFWWLQLFFKAKSDSKCKRLNVPSCLDWLKWFFSSHTISSRSSFTMPQLNSSQCHRKFKWDRKALLMLNVAKHVKEINVDAALSTSEVQLTPVVSYER